MIHILSGGDFYRWVLQQINKYLHHDVISNTFWKKTLFGIRGHTCYLFCHKRPEYGYL